MELSEKTDSPRIYAASWLLSPISPPLSGGAILVRNGAVEESGTLKELRRRHSVPVRQYPGAVILPGFVNAHTHLELTHFPSWKIRSGVDYHPRRFTDWIIQVIKVKRSLAPDDLRHSVNEGIRMCLESGTTAIGEILSDYSLAPLYSSSPLSGRFFFELLGQDTGEFGKLLNGAISALKECGGAFLPALSPHSAYTVGRANFDAIRGAAEKNSLPLSIHLSESREETDFIFNSSGPIAEELYQFAGWREFTPEPAHCTSTALLDSAGLLNEKTTAVHAVHLTLNDAEILKKRGVSVVISPRSNERLDTGKAPVALFKKFGIPLAIGTDSLASNDSLSLWDEMRFALDLFSNELSFDDLFKMATVGGAESLSLPKSYGTLLPGSRADFQVVEAEGDMDSILERVMGEGILKHTYLAGKRHAGGN